VDCAIIEVPAMAGDTGHHAADGPATITRALREAGHEFRTHQVAVQDPTGDVIADSIRVGRQIKEEVGAVLDEGDVPLVLAGSCDVASAVLAAMHRPVGVIWIDAHADFNTPESSVSGFWPGMTLAVIVGDCGESVLGRGAVAPERVLLIGIRSVSPEAQSVRLRNSGMAVVPWRDGLPERDVETALEELARQVDEVYLHLDLDALDPAVGRASLTRQ
jgi:arginase